MLLNTRKIRENLFFHLLSESVSLVVNKNIKLPQSLSAAAVLIFLCCNFNYAQVTKENYDKAVDFFNCKIVEKSLNETVRSSTEAEKPKAQQIYDRFQKESQNCQNTDYKGIQQLLDPDIYPMTKKLSAEVNLLKQKYSEEKSADQLVTFITDESLRDGAVYPLLIKFANKPRQVNDFAEFKEQLKTSLKNIIEVNEQPLKTPDNSNVQIPYSTPTEVSKDDKSWFDFVKLISLLNILVLIAGFVLFGLGYLYMSRKLRDADNSHKVKVSDTRLAKKKLNETSETLLRMSAQIKLLQNRMEDYEKSLNFYETSVQKLQSPPIAEKENRTYSSTGKTADQSYIEIIYFPIPNNGILKDDVKHFPFREGTSVYKFSKTSDHEADFEIDSHESAIRLAFNYPEQVIESVCVSTNKPNQTRRRIVTVQPGKAVLKSGKWEITEMAVIKYDSTASSPANSGSK